MSDKISVITPCFNHAKYINSFIESLINQTYKNWELIIVDDCSTDNSISVIKSYDDERIKLFIQPFNQGPGAALNKAFKESCGQIIVDMASDDKLHPEYFDFIVKKFSESSDLGVIYSSVDVMDSDDKIYDSWILDSKLSRFEYLKKLFFEFNTFYSPGMAVRRNIYQTIIPMNVSMIQHQDYQWHIQFLAKTDCFVSERPYVIYRSEKEKGISLGSNSIGTDNRFRLEINKLMDTFLEISDIEIIRNVTNSDLCEKLPKDCYKFIWAFEALKCITLEKRQWAYNVICDLYADDLIRNKLYECINFKFSDLLGLGKINYFKTDNIFQRKLKAVMKRVNKLFYK